MHILFKAVWYFPRSNVCGVNHMQKANTPINCMYVCVYYIHQLLLVGAFLAFGAIGWSSLTFYRNVVVLRLWNSYVGGSDHPGGRLTYVYATLVVITCNSLYNPWRHVRCSQLNWLHILPQYSFCGFYNIFKSHNCYILLMAYDSVLVIALYVVIQ